jgi:hypothetical protein
VVHADAWLQRWQSRHGSVWKPRRRPVLKRACRCPCNSTSSTRAPRTLPSAERSSASRTMRPRRSRIRQVSRSLTYQRPRSRHGRFASERHSSSLDDCPAPSRIRGSTPCRAPTSASRSDATQVLDLRPVSTSLPDGDGRWPVIGTSSYGSSSRSCPRASFSNRPRSSPRAVIRRRWATGS